ncbi:MAG: hypothetical protein ACR2QQ_00715 [Gammaproteobacteria bacterium]
MRRSAIIFLFMAGFGLRANAQGADFSGVYISVYVGSPDTVILPETYPFTAEGERAFADYDPAVDDPRVGNDCAPRRMPALLWSADPVEFSYEPGVTVVRFEVLDIVRTIVMDGDPPAFDQPHTELGYSIGRWEGDELIVETSHMLGGVIVNDVGHPISRDARLTERYWREPGESDLRVEVLVDDPVNYVEPLRLGRVWTYAPNEEIRPWDCFSLEMSDGETDVDDLARMLEAL